MALSLKQQIEVAEVLADRVRSSIYAYAKSGDTTFAECQELAPNVLLEAWRIAKEHIADLEDMAVESGLAERHTDVVLDLTLLRWREDEVVA